ncbi:MAG: small metal-binding protein [Candidatus Thorarchaeota archaeon]|nr:MAG: small metal-binding protein [Candidatus Thorarchaeota archaeon]
MPSFKCKDIGMKCGFTAKAKTQDELLKMIGDHARSVHSLNPVPQETMDKIMKAIKK